MKISGKIAFIAVIHKHSSTVENRFCHWIQVQSADKARNILNERSLVRIRQWYEVQLVESFVE